MFETSKDILFIVIAFCVLWLTIFCSWLMFYCISILRNFSKLVKDVREKYMAVEKAITSGVSHLAMIAEAVKRIVAYFLEGGFLKKKKK